MLDHKERGKKVAPLSSDMQQVTATCQQGGGWFNDGLIMTFLMTG